MDKTRFAWPGLFFAAGGLLLILSCTADSAYQLPAGGPAANKVADAWLAKVGELAQLGKVDQLVEQIVHHGHASRMDEAWQLVGQLGCNLIKWEQRDFQRTKFLDSFLSEGQKVPAFSDFGGLFIGPAKELTGSECVLTKKNSGDGCLLVRAEKIVIKVALNRGIFVSAGSIEVGKGGQAGGPIFFANDGVSLFPGGVVVCDGGIYWFHRECTGDCPRRSKVCELG